MPCEVVELEGVGRAIICTRGRKRKCSAAFCDEPATRLCDAPLTGKKAGKTCDRALCTQHAVNQGPDLDFCPAHAGTKPPSKPPTQRTSSYVPRGTQRCAPGDAAAALRELERAAPAKSEAGAFLVRSRGDVLDTDAVDFVYDCCFAPRDLDDWQEFVGERAAIFEYLGGQPRAVAEAKARQLAGPPPRYAKNGPLFAGAR